MLQNQAEFLKPNSKAYAKSSVIHYLPESKRRREQQRVIGHPQNVKSHCHGQEDGRNSELQKGKQPFKT